jgi:hypothetical protein
MQALLKVEYAHESLGGSVSESCTASMKRPPRERAVGYLLDGAIVGRTTPGDLDAKLPFCVLILKGISS